LADPEGWVIIWAGTWLLPALPSDAAFMKAVMASNWDFMSPQLLSIIDIQVIIICLVVNKRLEVVESEPVDRLSVVR
jgi:hypothetical protein